jgi:hypothetical protein
MWQLATGSYKIKFNNNLGGTFGTVMPLTNAGNLGIGITNSFASLTLETTIIAVGISNLSFVIPRNNGSGNRSFKMAIDDGFNLAIGDFGNGDSGNTWSSSQFTINYASGNV